jgi:hypothetical protein
MYTSSVLVRCSFQEILKIKKKPCSRVGGRGHGREEEKDKKAVQETKEKGSLKGYQQKRSGKCTTKKNGIPASGTHLAWKGNM